MKRSSEHRGPIHGRALWTLFGWTGVLFLLVAGGDVLLTWIPTDFGNREWEFGTITASFNGLLSVTFGMVMILGWLAQGNRALPLRIAAWAFVLMGVLVLAATALYWTNVPLALNAVEDSPVRVGLVKAVVKTGLQSVAFPIAFFFLARTSFRWGRAVVPR